MRFSLLATLAALGSVAVAQLGPTEVVANVNALTDKCKSLVAPAQQLSIVNAPLLLIGQGPWVVRVLLYLLSLLKLLWFDTVADMNRRSSPGLPRSSSRPPAS